MPLSEAPILAWARSRLSNINWYGYKPIHFICQNSENAPYKVIGAGKVDAFEFSLAYAW